MTVSYTEILLAGSILILPFLYESSHVFRYHLKFFFYYAYVMISSVILIPVFCLKARDVRNLLMASAFCHHVSTILGLRWSLRGREHLEKEEAYIIVSNHQSSIDILGLFDIWPVMDKCTVIAKREILYAWPFGLAAWLCGLVFIPRMNSDKSKIIMNEATEKIKKDKTKLWIFPEGTRRNTGQIHPFKKGAFHLAINSKIPILPVVFSQYYFLDKKNKTFDHGKIYITVLPPIPTENMSLDDDIDNLMEKTRHSMTTIFHESNKEIKESIKYPFTLTSQ